MPRAPRSDWPGARQHVMNRTVGGAALFLDDAACRLFVEVLAEVPERFSVRLNGYALLPDRYHLMLATNGNLSKIMRHVGSTFTQAWNRARGADGPVFRGRFHNAVIEADARWMHLLAHLHLEPVRTGTSPRDTAWSSHRAYVDPHLRPDWLDCDELLSQFGSARTLERYIQDLRVGARAAPGGFDPTRFGGPTAAPRRNVPEPGLRDPDQALADVATLLSVPRKQLMSLPRGRVGNHAAWLAVWWVLRSTGHSQTEIAKLWNVSRPRISQISDQLVKKAEADRQIRGWMDALEELRHHTLRGR